MLYKVGVNKILTTNEKIASKIKRIEGSPDPVEDRICDSEEELYVEVRGSVYFQWNRWKRVNEPCVRKKGEYLYYYVGNTITGDRVWYDESYSKLDSKLVDYMQMRNWQTSSNISVVMAIYLPLKGFTKKKAREVFEDRVGLCKEWLDDRVKEVMERENRG